MKVPEQTARPKKVPPNGACIRGEIRILARRHGAGSKLESPLLCTSGGASDSVHLLEFLCSRHERALFLAFITLCALVLTLKSAVLGAVAVLFWFAWALCSWLGWRQLLCSGGEVWHYHWQRGFDCSIRGELEVQGLWELRPYLMLIRYRADHERWRLRLLWPDSASVASLKILSGTLFCR